MQQLARVRLRDAFAKLGSPSQRLPTVAAGEYQGGITTELDFWLVAVQVGPASLGEASSTLLTLTEDHQAGRANHWAHARAPAPSARGAPRGRTPPACHPRGRSQLHPQSLSYYFDQTVQASGLPRIRFHDLQHTHATILLVEGEPTKAIQERLGHSSATITLDVYGHVTEDIQESTAARGDQAILGKE